MDVIVVDQDNQYAENHVKGSISIVDNPSGFGSMMPRQGEGIAYSVVRRLKGACLSVQRVAQLKEVLGFGQIYAFHSTNHRMDSRRFEIHGFYSVIRPLSAIGTPYMAADAHNLELVSHLCNPSTRHTYV